MDGGRRMGRRRAEVHNSTEHLFIERERLMLRFPVEEVKLGRMHRLAQASPCLVVAVCRAS